MLVGVLGIVMFTVIILALVAILMVAKAQLVPAADVKIIINGDLANPVITRTGGTLLGALAERKIFIPSACGGKGSCGVCTVHVHKGGGEMLPTEQGWISRGDARLGCRLACQVKVKQDMEIEVEPEVFSVQKWQCTVTSNVNVATFIKEFKLQLPPGESVPFRAGGYIQIDVPAYKGIQFKDFQVADKFREDWDKYNIWQYVANNDEPCFRAYSMANHPAEGNMVMLNIRIATPPPRTEGIPPGICSSYVFSLKAGDKITISGPYGEFFIKETENEMIYIGGGAGMAPLRSHIFHLFHTLRTGRKVSYWYGARSLRELFYEDHFRAIEKEFPNVSFHVALSEPMPEDNWTGPVGFIHQVVHDNYLKDHPNADEIEYYLCGPPMMLSAVQNMLYDLGVEKEQIAFDDFGS